MSRKTTAAPSEGPFGELVQEYLRERELAGYDNQSVVYTTWQMSRFLDERRDGRAVGVDRDDLEAWVDLSSSRGGRETRFSRMDSFCEFLQKKGYPAFRGEWRAYAHGTEFEARILTDDELARLFDACDSYAPSSRGKYDHPLMFPVLTRLLYGCGLRLGEAVRLKTCDINFDTGAIKIWHSKNDNSRVVHASESLTSVIEEYVPLLRAYEGEGHLFRSYEGMPYGKAACERVFRRVRTNAGLDGDGQQPVRLHDLRHNYAIRAMEKMADEGMDLYACLPLLSQYMGHSSLQETEYYIRLSKHGFHRVTDRTAASAASIFPVVE